MPVKILRSLLVVALLSFSASVVLADGVDPLVGFKPGGGSTPITVNNPNPTFSLVVVQDPGPIGASGPGTICTISGDTCAVVPPGQPEAGSLPVFQNQTAGVLTTLTVFIQDPTHMFNFVCNTNETAIFSSCSPPVSVAGGEDITFSGGSVPTAFVGDDDSDDAACLIAGPAGPLCSDDFNLSLGEFALDIEGIISGDPTNDLTAGTNISGATITSPEPGSALMLLFGMLALGLTKVVRRAA